MNFNARLGIVFFAIYAVIYFAFVLISAFWPDVMEQKSFWGLSLSVTSGFGLIAFAFVLSLLYGLMCRTLPNNDSRLNEGSGS